MGICPPSIPAQKLYQLSRSRMLKAFYFIKITFACVSFTNIGYELNAKLMYIFSTANREATEVASDAESEQFIYMRDRYAEERRTSRIPLEISNILTNLKRDVSLRPQELVYTVEESPSLILAILLSLQVRK